MVTRVKICGLTREDDARWAIECGADALGFIHEPASPRFIGEETPEWLAKLPVFPMKVAVFGRVNRTVPKTVFDAIQGVEWDEFPEPAPKRIHVIRLRNGQSARDLLSLTVNAGAIMLDAFHGGAYGGTGVRVDWEIAAEIVMMSAIPVILAGGLSPQNVHDAVRLVRPFAVDVSSGVEARPGVKDRHKVLDFICAAKGV